MSCTKECRSPRGRQAHCGACHRTFSGITIFDGHRIGGGCKLPQLMGLTEKNRVWGNRDTGSDWFRRALL